MLCFRVQVRVASYVVRERILTRSSRANYFNYINLDQPDNSGMLRFLTDELQDAEDAGDRGEYIVFVADPGYSKCCLVWIIGHVLSGWDGSNRAYCLIVRDTLLTPS